MLMRTCSLSGQFLLPCGLAIAASLLPLTTEAAARQPRAPGTGTPVPAKPAPAQPAPETPAQPATPAQQPVKPSASTPVKNKPASPTSTAPVEPPAPSKGEPQIGPYVTLSQTKELNLTVRVRVLRGNQEQQINDPSSGQSATVVTTLPFDPMKSIAMIWPLLPRSASSISSPDAVTGKLLLNDGVAASSFTVMKNYQGGVQYARFDAVAGDKDLTPSKVELVVTVPASVSRTSFDESSAVAVAWPSTWPRTVGTWLEPQLFVETAFDQDGRLQVYKEDAVVAALKAACDKAGVSDLKKVSPVAAAKIITSYVWGQIQVVSNTINRTTRSGELPAVRLSKGDVFTGNDLGGVLVQSPQSTLEAGRGTEYDTCALLTAMLKKAGVPAHPVVGYDRGSSSSGMKSNLGSKSKNESRGTRCWVEFALYDEAKNTLNWVPIDIGRLNKTSSRPMPLDKPWRYFGTHDELNSVVPFAFHFFPPTDVVSYGAPGFWGWFVTPAAPKNAGQAIMLSVAAASSRGGEPAAGTPQDDSSMIPATDSKKKPGEKDARDDKKKKRGY
jgi:Transglutaminase-like superfamily